jgi:NAD(P)-dependent dehydrogenase (short-subunit alcohol dehydrogenase family)
MASNQLDGKIAIITGGSRGLGREMAIGFAAAGAAGVTITAAPGSDEAADSIQAELNEVLTAIKQAGGQGIASFAEVSDANDCKRVVNNAAKSGRYVRKGRSGLLFHQADPDGYREIIDTNILGPFLMAWASTQHLMDQGWGRIINISKNVDSMHAAAISPYGPTKAALDAATLEWAGELSETGVTINSLSPGGAINTKFGTGKIPGKGLDPRVIVPMSIWLASTASDGITGADTLRTAGTRLARATTQRKAAVSQRFSRHQRGRAN